MTDLIRHIATWFRTLTGYQPPERYRYDDTRPPLRRPRPSLPRHRSPYGIETPLDGTASALVRPYLTTHMEVVAS